VTQKIPAVFSTATVVAYRDDIAQMDPNYKYGLNALSNPPGAGREAGNRRLNRRALALCLINNWTDGRAQLLRSPLTGAISHPHDDLVGNRVLPPRRRRIHCGLRRGRSTQDATDL
jgi:hypothetical protein